MAWCLRARRRRHRSAIALAAICAGLAGHATHARALGPNVAAAPSIVANASQTDSSSLSALCLGFLLPDARSVVTSAHCAQSTSVVLIGTDHEPVVVPVSSLHPLVHDNTGEIGALTAWRLDVAIGSLAPDASGARTASPIVFDRVDASHSSKESDRIVRYDVRSQNDLQRGDRALVLSQINVHVVAGSECRGLVASAVDQQWASEGSTSSSRGALLCGHSEWSSLDTCQAAAANATAASSLVTVERDGVAFALGFVAAAAPCRLSVGGTSSSVAVVTPVVELVLTRSGNGKPVQLAPSSTPPASSAVPSLPPLARLQESAPASPLTAAPAVESSSSSLSSAAQVVGDTVLDVKHPPLPSLASSDSSGSSSVASSVGDVNATSASDRPRPPQIRDAVVTASLAYPFALLSSSQNVTTVSVPAYQIAPTFLVSNPEWLGALDGGAASAIFSDDTIAVKKLWFENDAPLADFEDPNFIVVIELARAYHRPGEWPLRPSASTIAFELQVLQSPFATLDLGRDNTLRSTALSVCRLPSTTQVGLECLVSALASSTGAGDPATTETPVMGFVFYDGKLAGLTSGALSADATGVGRHIRMVAISIAFRHAFLLEVILASQVPATQSATERTYRKSAVQFLVDGVPVDCGGVVIAHDTILTTATCALTYRPTACVVSTRSEQEASSLAATDCVVRPDATVVHPLYQQQNSGASTDAIAAPQRFDFAILKLASFLPTTNIVALAPAALTLQRDDAVVRVDLGRRAGADAAVVLERAQCSDVLVADREPQTPLFCAKTIDNVAASSSSAALCSKRNGEVVLLALQTSSGRIGATQTYSSIEDARAFISANVYGFADPNDALAAGTVVPDEVVAASLAYPLAYLSYGLNVTTSSVLAFQIAPTFLVTNREWLPVQYTSVDDGSTSGNARSAAPRFEFVVFGDDKVPVKALRFESGQYPVATSIVVIELTRAYRLPGVRLVTAPLQSMDRLEMAFLDPELLLQQPRGGNRYTAHRAALGVCDLSGKVAEDEGLSCLAATRSSAPPPSSSARSARMAVVVLPSGELAGFGTGAHALAHSELVMRALVFSMPRRQGEAYSLFLDATERASLEDSDLQYKASSVQFLRDKFPLVCGGVVIAADAVLTTAACAVGTNISMLMWARDGSSGNVVISPSDVVLERAAAATDAAVRDHSLAIVRLHEPLSMLRIAPLASDALPVGRPVVRVDVSTLSSHVDPCAVLDDAVCTETASASALASTLCAGNTSAASATHLPPNSVALFDPSAGDPRLAGFQVAHDDTKAFAQSYVRVRDAIEFINANAVGRVWGDAPSEMSDIPDDVLRASLAYPFVYLSPSSPSVSVRSVAGVHVAPRVVVTNADWIGEDSAIDPLAWAVFQDEAIEIEAMQLEREYYGAMGSPSSIVNASNLVLIKLARAYALRTSAENSAGSLALARPTTPKALELKVLDPVLLWRGVPVDHYSSLDATSACAPSANASAAGIACVHTMFELVSAFARGTPMRMAFALQDGNAFGVSTASQRLTNDVHVPVARLDDPRRLAFVQATVRLWDEDATSVVAPGDSSGHDTSDYRSAVVRLIARGSIFDCGGVLITPQFVLTTASCLASANTSTGTGVSGVIYRGPIGSGFASVDESATVVHPLYKRDDAHTLRYNLAILTLSSAVPADVTPIALAPFALAVGDAALRVELTNATRVAALSILPQDTCSGAAASPLSSGMVCVGNASTEANASSESAVLIGTLDGEPMLVGLQATAAATSYVSVLAAANFINAFTHGHQWGLATRRPPSRKPLSLSYMVALRITKTGQRFCGGVLIASQYVLTAAHCVSDGLVQWASIGYSNDNTIVAEDIRVLSDRIRIHPKYGSPHPFSFDAAILELAVPTSHSPILLFDDLDFADNSPSSLLSFRSASAAIEGSARLSALILPLWSQRKCEATVPDADSSVLCAGGSDGLDACTGDSGSPLVVQLTKKVNALVGVVSAGYGCGQADVPGLYTRVTAIRDFIAAYTTPARIAPLPQEGSSPPSVPLTTAPPPSPVSPVDRRSPSSTSNSGGTTTPASTPRPPAPSGSSPATPASPTSTPSATVVFPLALVREPLPTTSPLTRDKVLAFVIGDDSAVTISSSLRNRLTSRLADVELFSSGDLSGVMRVVAAHDALPLNQRSDRFGSVTAHRVGQAPLTTASCI